LLILLHFNIYEKNIPATAITTTVNWAILVFSSSIYCGNWTYAEMYYKHNADWICAALFRKLPPEEFRLPVRVL